MRLLHREVVPSTVRLSMDEASVLLALLDALVDPDLQRSDEVLAVTARVRQRLAEAMVAAGSEPGARPR